jgi:hypothetical protein
MTITTHLTEFAGKPVLEFPAEQSPDPSKVIYRIRVDWDDKDTWQEKFAGYLELPHVEASTGLVIGNWKADYPQGTPEPIIQALVASREKLPNLEAIFLGDITFEENEMTWIENTDVSPLLTAFPDLKIFRVRGANGLSLGGLNHEELRHLAVETGGMPRRILDEILESNLPKLEHLELWLGDDYYGFDFGLEALQPILKGEAFPNLTYLGLCNSKIADEIAQAIVEAPILDQLQVLDLSKGTLGDEGAQALLDSERITSLVRLDISHHYCSDEMMSKLLDLPIEVDVSSQEAEDIYEYDGEVYIERYVLVSE